MKVYIIVRKTEDFEFNTVDVFQGVCSTPEKADKFVEDLKEDFGFKDDPDFNELEILERNI